MPYTKEQDCLIKLSRLSADPPPEIKGVDLDGLLKTAAQNGLLSYVFDKILKLNVQPEELRKYEDIVSNKRLMAAAKHIEFEFLAKKLDQGQIPFIPLKGIVLSKIIYPSVELREMQDIDILVKYEDSTRLNTLLKDLNYIQNYADKEVRKDILPLLCDKKLREYIDCVEFKRADSDLEVHFMILPSKIHSIPNEELWALSTQEDIKGLKLRLLCPEHQLLNIATHSFRHNMAYGIRPIAEIDAIIKYYGKRFDWTKFVQMNRKYDLAELSYAPFYLACKFYGSVPVEAIEQMEEHCSRTSLSLAQELFLDFFNRYEIPNLYDSSLYFHIVRQKKRLKSLFNIFFPPLSVLRLKERDGKKRFSFIYFQYLLRFARLFKTYLPGILKSVLYKFKFRHGRNNIAK